MNKKFKFLYLPLIAFSFSLSSCNSSVPYEVIKYSDSSNKLKVDGSLSYFTYDCTDKSGDNLPKLSLDGLVINYEGNVIDLSNRLSSIDDIKANKGGYFLSTNENAPLNAIINSMSISTSEEKNTTSFYIAVCDYKGENKETKVYLSNKFTFTVINNKALKKWVYYVVSAVIIAAIFVLIYFSKKYKEKH